jgi:glutamine amidotransferase
VNVVLVDSGGANIGSVRYALERLGVDARMSGDADEIRGADRVILPGVGAALPAMARLNELGLVPVLRTLEPPLLGICLGMQLLFESSEEGDVACLGLLPGVVARMPESPGVRVPHMGWNRLQRRADSPLLDGIDEGSQAYFVHSFAAPVTADCVASCGHGQPFAAVVQRGRVAGAQFHPERSAAVGARLIENFLRHGLS